MKELIIQALFVALEKLERSVPKTKRELKEIRIGDVKPLELADFMKKNGVPDNAEFSSRCSEDDGYDDIVLDWYIDVPTTHKDNMEYRKRRFDTYAFKAIYDLLIANGYRRKGFDSGLLKNFKDTTPYEMYVKGDYDRMTEYYSLSFAPPVE